MTTALVLIRVPGRFRPRLCENFRGVTSIASYANFRLVFKLQRSRIDVRTLFWPILDQLRIRARVFAQPRPEADATYLPGNALS
jgi:hypothetical protein